MLFGYPIAATGENWLHECLCQIVLSVQELIAAGHALPPWPSIVPPDHQERLRSRRGLKDRVIAYSDAIRTLNDEDFARIVNALANQNRIAELLNGTCDCPSIEDLPEAARQPILNLFGFGFELLSALGVRDRQYELIYEKLQYRLCPFCGCEYFESPKGPREALDHYLAESRYPFAASNLRNLAPMGHKCNSAYKLAKDILYCEDGHRRRAFDPYLAPGLQVLLDNSQVNQTIDGPLISDWIVEFSIDAEETETWNDVFSIRERYKRDFLEELSFRNYLEEFQNWHASTGLIIASDDGLLNALERYQNYLKSFDYKDRMFLRAAVFRMLLIKCESGCDRVLGVMRDLAGLPQPV